jgi:hypothetical protein
VWTWNKSNAQFKKKSLKAQPEQTRSNAKNSAHTNRQNHVNVKTSDSVLFPPTFCRRRLVTYLQSAHSQDSQQGPTVRMGASTERAERSHDAITSEDSGTFALGFVAAAFGSVQLIKLQSGIPSRFGRSLKFDIADRRGSQANQLPNLGKRQPFAA